MLFHRSRGQIHIGMRDRDFRRASRPKTGITPPKIAHKDECAFIDRTLQVLGAIGNFAPAPRLSSPFSTVEGDKCGRLEEPPEARSGTIKGGVVQRRF